MHILKLEFSFEPVTIKVRSFMKVMRQVEVCDGEKKNMLSC